MIGLKGYLAAPVNAQNYHYYIHNKMHKLKKEKHQNIWIDKDEILNESAL